MSARRVILHIGTEKTGTSAIQRFLARNRQALAQQNVLYSRIPNGANHFALAAYAIDADPPRDFHRLNDVTRDGQGEFRTRIRAELSAELDTGNTVILSNEHLSSRAVHSAELDRIVELFREVGADVDVVVYLRRLVPMIEASHSTYVKSGRTRPFDLDGEVSWRARYDLNALIERWDSAFPGRVDVRLYREDVKEDRTAIIRDFLEAASIRVTDDFSFAMYPVNPSLPRAATNLGRLLNQAADSLEPELFERLRRLYNLKAERSASGPPFHLSDAQAAVVDDAYRDSLEALRPRIGDAAVDYLSDTDRKPVPEPSTLDSEKEWASAVGALLVAAVQAVREQTDERLAPQERDEEVRKLRAALESEQRERTSAEAVAELRAAELSALTLEVEQARRELTQTRAAAAELERVRATRVWRWSAPARSLVARLRRRRTSRRQQQAAENDK